MDTFQLPSSLSARPSHTLTVGVFDSGIGGLTILHALQQRLPQYRYVYLADSANAPYGCKSSDEVLALTRQAVEWLFEMAAVDYVILACNTASVCQSQLPAFYKHRVFSIIEPTILYADSLSYTGHIGLLATQRTFESGLYSKLLKACDPVATLHAQAAPDWVAMIESGHCSRPLIKQTVTKLLDQSTLIDTIILGCTHFPIIAGAIQQMLPDNISLVSQGGIIANYILGLKLSNNSISYSGQTQFFTTGSYSLFTKQARLFLQQNINVLSVQLAIS
ncbi:glutamate racemase [Spirosoma harenae]